MAEVKGYDLGPAVAPSMVAAEASLSEAEGVGELLLSLLVSGTSMSSRTK